MKPEQLREIESYLDEYKSLLEDELTETAAGCRVAFLQYLNKQIPNVTPVAVARVAEAQHDAIEAHIEWLYNPMPVGTLLYESPEDAAVRAVTTPEPPPHGVEDTK